MSQALERLAQRKLDEALTLFEAARALEETEAVTTAIRSVRMHLETEAAADHTAAEIQAVLDDGRADEVVKLGNDALSQFGDTPSAERLMQQVRQANSLLAAQSDDKTARRARLQSDFDSAQKDRNLRAAALCLEQLLQEGGDAELQQKLDDIRGTLTKYDALRADAAELRRHPNRLDEALTKLQEAAKLWDTPAVQQDIADMTDLVQQRRDRVAVAEFEVRGDVGIPQAGAFRGR